jgi:hypothetical protein
MCLTEWEGRGLRLERRDEKGIRVRKERSKKQVLAPRAYAKFGMYSSK